jgi:anti-anti-sigma regulatory factor
MQAQQAHHLAHATDSSTWDPCWHRVGQRWRPLHDQLGALHDASVWASAGTQPVERPTHQPRRESGATTVGVAQLDGEFAALTINGPVDLRTVNLLRGMLRLLLDAGVREVVLDLAEISKCDVRLAAVLLTLRARLTARHGTLVLVNPPATAQQALTLGRLTESFLYCTGSARQDDAVRADSGPR